MPVTRPQQAKAEGLSDEDLVSLARERDEAAVRTITTRYNRRLFRIARSILRNDAEAEDVVQETYVRAFTGLDMFRGDAAFSTWITRIAMNEALGRLRRGRHTAPTVSRRRSFIFQPRRLAAIRRKPWRKAKYARCWNRRSISFLSPSAPSS